MGMLNQGLNIPRDVWNNLHDDAALGTGTTQETAQDTGLESPISTSDALSVSTTASHAQFLVKAARFSGVSTTSDSVTEMVWKTDSNDQEGSRITFPSIVKNTTSDLVIETRWYWRGRR